MTLLISTGYLNSIAAIMGTEINQILNANLTSISSDVTSSTYTSVSYGLIVQYQPIQFNSMLSSAFNSSFTTSVDTQVRAIPVTISNTSIIFDLVDYLTSLIFTPDCTNFTTVFYTTLQSVNASQPVSSGTQNNSFEQALQQTIVTIFVAQFNAVSSFKINDQTYNYSFVSDASNKFQFEQTPASTGLSVAVLAIIMLIAGGVSLLMFYFKAEIVGSVYKKDFAPPDNRVVIIQKN